MVKWRHGFKSIAALPVLYACGGEGLTSTHPHRLNSSALLDLSYTYLPLGTNIALELFLDASVRLG
jgi:hypothetical protein